MSLMDIVKKHSTKKKSPMGVRASAGDVGSLLQTARTGKAPTAGAGPATSQLGAQQAAQQVDTQARGQAQTQARAGQQMARDVGLKEEQIDTERQAVEQGREQQLADIAAREDVGEQQLQAQREQAVAQRETRERMTLNQITNTYANNLADLASERNTIEQNLFSDLKQNMDRLGKDKAMAELEQLGHQMALSDQKYLDELKRVGMMRDLADEQKFRREAMEVTFQKDFDILSQQFDMQRLINADEREFRKAMARMDVNFAMDMAKQAMKEQQFKSILTGAVQIGSAYATSDTSE